MARQNVVEHSLVRDATRMDDPKRSRTASKTPSSTDDGDVAIHGTSRARDPLDRTVVPSRAHDGVAVIETPRALDASPEVGSDWRTTPDFSSLRFGLVP